MCIAILKPAGTELPSEETLKHCFQRNPDGAGLMIATGSEVLIRKGFATWEAFEAGLNRLRTEFGDLREKPLGLHFRIGTHGSKNAPEHTHPFPLVELYDQMESLELTAACGVMHNGIISNSFGATRYTSYGLSSWDNDAQTWKSKAGVVLQPSDTMEFIKHVLAPLQTVPNWLDNPLLVQLMLDLLGSTSRLALMTPDGTFYRFGTWIPVDGLMYSNETYKPYVAKTIPVTTETKPAPKHEPKEPLLRVERPSYRYDLDRASTTEADRVVARRYLNWFETLVSIRLRMMKEQLRDNKKWSADGYKRLTKGNYRVFYSPAKIYFNNSWVLPIAVDDPKKHIYVNDKQTIAYEYDPQNDLFVTLGSVKYIDFEPEIVAAAKSWWLGRSDKRKKAVSKPDPKPAPKLLPQPVSTPIQEDLPCLE